MTIVYCDYTSGDDSTGTGAAGAPYKTITQASTGLTGGDEVRVAQNAAPTALAGTLAWVDGSNTITTSADLSGVLAAKNFIRPIGRTLPWEVLSVTSDTITLKVAYCGTTQTAASYKINPHDTGTAAGSTTTIQGVSASGISGTPLIISGGWNLSTLAQTGETWFLQSGTSLYGYGLYQDAKTDVTVSDMGFLRYNYGFHQNSTSTGDRENLYGIGCARGVTVYAYNSKSVMYGLYGAGCTGIGVYINSSSSGTGSLTDVKVYSCTDVGISISSALGMSLITPTAKRCVTGIEAWGTLSMKIVSPTVENCTTGIVNDYGSELVVYNPTLTSNTTDMSVSNLAGSELPVLFSHYHNGVAGDNRAYGMYGVSQSNTADARTGVCLKISPTSATQYFRQRIGLCRVASTGADITLGVYIKDDAAFNGTLEAAIYHLGECITDWASWTPTTTYTLNTALADASDLVVGEMLELWVRVTGTAGNVYIDDSTPSYGSVETDGYPAAGKLLQADGGNGVVEASNTNSEVAAAVVASHTRSHSLISSLDHTSLATSGQLLKANASGLPVDATNTDAEVAAAVMASHAHPDGTTTGDFLRWNSVSEAWEVSTQPIEVTQITLTPAEAAALDAEGGLWYKSTDKSVYVCTDDTP